MAAGSITDFIQTAVLAHKRRPTQEKRSDIRASRNQEKKRKRQKGKKREKSRTYVPAPHMVHATDPTSCAILPAGHGVHHVADGYDDVT